MLLIRDLRQVRDAVARGLEKVSQVMCASAWRLNTGLTG
jgi:hypothetical protein